MVDGERVRPKPRSGAEAGRPRPSSGPAYPSIMSAGATDGLFLRNAGIPTYGTPGSRATRQGRARGGQVVLRRRRISLPRCQASFGRKLGAEPVSESALMTDSCWHETCFALRRGWGTFGESPWRSISGRAALTPARVITAVAVFTFGMLAGAGIAAWLMPPSGISIAAGQPCPEPDQLNMFWVAPHQHG